MTIYFAYHYLEDLDYIGMNFLFFFFLQCYTWTHTILLKIFCNSINHNKLLRILSFSYHGIYFLCIESLQKQ